LFYGATQLLSNAIASHIVSYDQSAYHDNRFGLQMPLHRRINPPHHLILQDCRKSDSVVVISELVDTRPHLTCARRVS
jgi:hypothetical protein